jgi:hypothetical protein
MESIPGATCVAKNLRPDRQKGLVGKQINKKMTLNDIVLLLGDQLLLSHQEKIFPVIDENKNRDPQLYNVESMRDLGTLSLKWHISTQGLERGERKIVKARGDGVIDDANETVSSIHIRTGAV